MKIINIFLLILCIFLLYIFFFKKRFLISEDMTNIDVMGHTQHDYNV